MPNHRPIVSLMCAAVLMGCSDSAGIDRAIAPTAISFAKEASGPSANGHGHLVFTAPDGDGLRTFSFHARTHEDGTTTGSFEVHNRATDARAHGDIDCLRIVGNRAYMSGMNTKSTDPRVHGRPFFFSVQDNGEGKNAPPDRISFHLTFLPPGPSFACNVPFAEPEHPVQGNIQVKP